MKIMSLKVEKMKKAFIIILCAVIGMSVAVAAAFLIVKSLKTQMVNTPELSSQSEVSSESSQISSSQAVQSTVEELFLKITEPALKKFTTTSSTVTFKGNTNIPTGVELNGKQIKLQKDKDGTFTTTEKLKYGNNKFTFKAGEFTETFNIYRKYTVAKSYSPKTEQTYSAGAKFDVSVTARTKAKVKATFNGKTITLEPTATSGNDFTKFTGSFTLPSGHFKDLNLGKIKFKATYKDYTDTFTSKNIICKKEKIVVSYDEDTTPSGGSYINVGSGIITEIVAFQAETFSGTGKSDTSKPYYNYLPEGTVDYGSSDYATVTRDGKKLKLITLRCGKKIYMARYDKPPLKKVTVAKQYTGTLPDHNEIKVSSLTQNLSHTVLTLDTLWKAPFDFELKKQKYNSGYTVTNVTFNYVDITFCYATAFEGTVDIPDGNPLFSKAKVIKNESDYTLRLYLKKQGGFYGWDAYYNSNDQLCFEFLNPAKVTLCDNEYGADLTGVKILIDIGHGGIDSGAMGVGNYKNREAARNLILGKKLASELKSIGATVYMTRTDDSTRTTDYKVKMLKNLKPDYCIAIHHDSNDYSSLNGFGAYYYYPFSKNAAEYVLNHTFNTGIYKKKTFKWHYYFMSRVSVCPVVLTENGYMSNRYDYNNITDNAANTKKAKALTKGIVEYFVSIQ